jgi:superfamily II DNA or RNA helicase
MSKLYLSEIPNIFDNTLQVLQSHGSVYLNAPCGSGKTQFAKNIIHKFQEHHKCEFNQIIYLIDTLNGMDQLIESD